MKTSEPKPTKEEILQNWVVKKHISPTLWFDILEAMQEFADLYHKEKMRDEFDKINCLTGYLERWLSNPLSVPPFELKDVIKESNEWISEYLKTKE